MVPDLRLLVRPSDGSCTKEKRRIQYGSLEHTYPYSCDSLQANKESCEGILSILNQNCHNERCGDGEQLVNGFCKPALGTARLPPDYLNHSISDYCNGSMGTVNEALDEDQLTSFQFESTMFTRDGVVVTINSTNYCFWCEIYYFDNGSAVKISNSEIQLHQSERVIKKPFYLFTPEGNLVTCYRAASDINVGEGRWHYSCSWVKDNSLLSLVLISISIVCLVAMILIYSTLPIFRNTPGVIILSQVSKTFAVS